MSEPGFSGLSDYTDKTPTSKRIPSNNAYPKQQILIVEAFSAKSAIQNIRRVIRDSNNSSNTDKKPCHFKS